MNDQQNSEAKKKSQESQDEVEKLSELISEVLLQDTDDNEEDDQDTGSFNPDETGEFKPLK